jgi:hypothetical protein
MATKTRGSLSAACGAWRNLAGTDNAHEDCTGRVNLPPPDDVCTCHCHQRGICRWFALCDHEAVGTVPHPVLGDVPACQRCVDKLDLPVKLF